MSDDFEDFGTINIGGVNQGTGANKYEKFLYDSTGGGGNAMTGFNEGGLYTSPDVDAYGTGWETPSNQGWNLSSGPKVVDSSVGKRPDGGFYQFDTKGAMMLASPGSGSMGGTSSGTSSMMPASLREFISKIPMPGSLDNKGQQRSARFYQAQAQMLNALLPYLK
jgi:hypothetical protein